MLANFSIIVFFVTFLPKRQIETDGLFTKFLSKRFAKISSLIFKYFFAIYLPKPVLKITSYIHKNISNGQLKDVNKLFKYCFFATYLPKRQIETNGLFTKFLSKQFAKISSLIFKYFLRLIYQNRNRK